MKYRCHQCFNIIEFEQIAHVDMFFDLCWVQCDVCAAEYGVRCGSEKQYNPNPHGYLQCPLRVEPSHFATPTWTPVSWHH